MDAQLQQLLLDRLAGADGLPADAADVLLAATEGPIELRRALDGAAPDRTAAEAQAPPPPDPPGVLLASIAVQGFRGIGPPAQLDLTPGPGLTLVVGRNGSGKSSFAEGLELLMTGANSRWTGRTKVWTEGWQNLHATDATRLEATVYVDGERGLTKLAQEWPHGAGLASGPAAVRRGDGTTTSLAELGWTAALSRYRPFLSYNELGEMFDELKTMYDALAAILGLDDLEALRATLREARLARERALKDAKSGAAELRGTLAAVDDARAETVVRALERRPPDLDTIELTLAGVDIGASGRELQVLRALCSLALPEPETVDEAFAALREATEAVAALAGSDAERAAATADLLDRALVDHDGAHAADCPVCGAEGRLDAAWRDHAAAEVERLRTVAREVEVARSGLRAATARVAELLPPAPPAPLAQAAAVHVDADAALEAWRSWSEACRDLARKGGEPARVALQQASVASRAVADRAATELDRREDLWRPVAKRVNEWLVPARKAFAAAERLDALKAAEGWVKDAAGDLQAERLAPIADAAKANWDQLRQDSNVSLDGFHLRRSGNARSAEVDVRVDGTEASAFGVMSQGELHALAVSVFLPRAALPASPFRFMVIDDPVQSMDPAKVDGLARVLEQAAAERQVIVFTHDERLPEAVRRLAIEADVLEVTRRPRSIVEVRPALDPVERYVADARALLKEDGLPADVARRVVPGFCRHALEAAAAQAFRRRRLGRGERHAEVEEELERATRLNSMLALALFDDAGRGGDVLGSINNRWGRRRGDVVTGCNRGAHEVLGGDLQDFVREAAVLARDVAALS